MHKKDFTKGKRIIIYILGIIGFLSTIIFTSLSSKMVNKPVSIFYEYLTINVLLEAISIFVFAKEHFKTNNIIEKISKFSFGAYLVHLILLENLNTRLHINTLSFNPVISLPVIVVIVFIASYIISGIINQIPILKKYVV